MEEKNVATKMPSIIMEGSMDMSTMTSNTRFFITVSIVSEDYHIVLL
jgi:hypothetical protein